MKKLLILYILLLLCPIVRPEMYSTSHYIQNADYCVGYTTTNVVNQPSYGYTGDSKIGYTTQYSNVYNPNTALSYNDDYYVANDRGYAHPRKAPGDHSSGSESVTVDGYTATISWSVDADIMGWVLWTITYSDGTQETYWGSFGHAKSHAAEVAREKAEKEAQRMADNPPDPFGDPIGEPYILFGLALIYCVYAYRKKKIVSV